MDNETTPENIEQQVDTLIEAIKNSHNTPIPVGTINEVYVANDRALKALGKPTIPALLKNLKSEDDETRDIAARVLGEVGDESVVEPLIALMLDELGTPKWIKVGLSAAGSLGQIGDPRAIKPLIEAVKLFSGSGWGYFLEALGRLGDPAKRAVIETAEQQGDLELQKAAMSIVSWYVDSGVCDNDPRMLTIIAQKYPYTDRRVRAIEKLAALGDGQSKGALFIIATWDKDAKVVEAANKALIKLEQDEQK